MEGRGLGVLGMLGVMGVVGGDWIDGFGNVDGWDFGMIL
jgi:hypothetical protein